MVLLLAVIVAMKEAGKPERWMWMGFDKVDQAPQEGDFLVDASNGSAKAESQGEMDWGLAKSASGPSVGLVEACLLYTSPSPRDQRGSRMPSSA